MLKCTGVGDLLGEDLSHNSENCKLELLSKTLNAQLVFLYLFFPASVLIWLSEYHKQLCYSLIEVILMGKMCVTKQVIKTCTSKYLLQDSHLNYH